MNDRQLRYILEIAKTGSITAAAQNLYISQPSLSNLLSNVENELGAKIFDRSVSPLILTYAGEKYIAAAERILGTMRELQHQIDDLKDFSIGRLAIGCGAQESPLVIPKILRPLMTKFPGVQFTLTEEKRSVLEDKLQNGTLDVIIYGGAIKNPDIECIPLRKREMLLIAPSDYVPGNTKRNKDRMFPCIDLESLEDYPFVLMKRSHRMRELQDFIFMDNDFVPNIILETGSWQTCLRMVESKIAFTVLPYERAEIYKHDVGLFSFENDYHRQSFICYKKNAYFSKLVSEFIEIVRSIF